MASIRLKPDKSQYYYACFTDQDNVQRQKSTRTTNRKLAQQIADALEQPFRERCTTTQLRKSFTEIAGKVGKKADFGIKVREYFQRWLRDIQGEPGSETFIRYSQIVRDSLLALGKAADLPLDEIDKSDFIDARQAIAERTSARNANTYLKVCKRIMRAAVDDELRGNDPTRKIKLLNEEEPGRDERRPFTQEELLKLREVLTGEWPLIVHFAEHTGQRLGDIVSAKRKQFDLQKKIWKFWSEKTNREMRVPLTPSLFEAVKKLPPASPDAPVFPQAFEKKQAAKGQTRGLSATFRKFLELAGLVTKRSKRNTGFGHGRRRRTSELSFHSFRHNATSNLAAAGVSGAILRDIIGHESELISRDYTHIADFTKVEAVRNVDDRSPVHSAEDKA
ncbi:MAG TPA: tyrosine-type recombinase/integrase [Terracidiphilus sp.]|nr:tyrosine-type recombinase/integrase [Terracidiphilus sp.]